MNTGGTALAVLAARLVLRRAQCLFHGPCPHVCVPGLGYRHRDMVCRCQLSEDSNQALGSSLAPAQSASSPTPNQVTR